MHYDIQGSVPLSNYLLLRVQGPSSLTLLRSRGASDAPPLLLSAPRAHQPDRFGRNAADADSSRSGQNDASGRGNAPAPGWPRSSRRPPV